MPDSIDLSKFTLAELMGCVLLGDASDEQHGTAIATGLCAYWDDPGDFGHGRTTTGDGVLEKLQGLLDGLDTEQLEDMQHALGSGHRNRYVAELGSRFAGSWARLVTAGLAEEGLRINDGGDRMFCVSDVGRAVLALHKRKSPQVSGTAR